MVPPNRLTAGNVEGRRSLRRTGSATASGSAGRSPSLRRLELPDSTTQCHCPHHRSCHAPPSPVSSKSTAQEYLRISSLSPDEQELRRGRHALRRWPPKCSPAPRPPSWSTTTFPRTTNRCGVGSWGLGLLQRHPRPQPPCYTRDGNSERGGAPPWPTIDSSELLSS